MNRKIINIDGKQYELAPVFEDNETGYLEQHDDFKSWKSTFVGYLLKPVKAKKKAKS